MRYLISTLFVSACFAGALLLGPAWAGEAGLIGNWKITIYEDSRELTFWILRVSNKNGVTGDVVALRNVPPSALQDFQLVDDVVRFKINLNNKATFFFEGKLPPQGSKKMFGSISRGPQTIPAVLEATTANNQFELDRELLLRRPTDPAVFNTTIELLKNGKAEKATAKDVQEWVERALRSADLYGPRWSTDVSMKLLGALTPDWNESAAVLSRQLLAKLGPKAPVTTQIRLLEVQAQALNGLGQAAGAQAVTAAIDKLEVQAYTDHLKTAPAFGEKFAGRKKNSSRAVLLELFTGAQCPPCVAADMAFDAVERTYKPSEVVLLQYHLHVPGPDALTNPAGEARQEYYAEEVRGTPCTLFNGKVGAPGGGGPGDGEDKFKEFRSVIDPLLDKATPIKIMAQAVRKNGKIAIRAVVDGVPSPSEKVRLRVAIVEDWVRYQARNGLTYHHRVVRTFAGGAKGIALTKKDTDHTLAVDLDEVHRTTSKYLETFAAAEAPFPDSQRPLRLRNLHMVAFVQNDENKEVLQAFDAPVQDQP